MSTSHDDPIRESTVGMAQGSGLRDHEAVRPEPLPAVTNCDSEIATQRSVLIAEGTSEKMLEGPLVFVDIDTQRDFLEPTGALYVPGSAEILAQLGRLDRVRPPTIRSRSSQRPVHIIPTIPS